MAQVVQFPMECPTCKTPEGKPYAIDGVIRGGEIHVWLRCAYCNHEWRYGLPVRNSTLESGVHHKPPV